MPQDEAGPAQPVAHFWTEYKVPLIFTFVSILLIIFSVSLLIKSIQTAAPITFSTPSATSSSEAKGNITVDVSGAVEKPGVYKLTKGARVGEAITTAGGLNKNADTEYVSGKLNQAAVLTDGAKIYIPEVEDSAASYNLDSLSRRQETSYNESPLLQRPEGSSQNGSLISINSASQSELESLPGIGPVIAGKIIAGRPYGELRELTVKKVMSQSLFNKLENLLSL